MVSNIKKTVGDNKLIETSIPVNFTVDCLETPLKQKQVTATIRGQSYIEKFNLKVGSKIEVKYHRKRVGFAVIEDIRLISYSDLFNPDIVKKEGFMSADELINALKPFWRWHWKRIQTGKQKMPLIEFKWI